jgi:alkylhydroperoxidase family enzyme
VLSSYRENRDAVLVHGLVDFRLKEICARFLAGEGVAPSGEKEQAALDWADAIAWDSDRSDADLWDRLHGHFSEPELVELGYAIAFMLGQQHWLRTLGVPPEIPQADGAA